VPRLPERKKHRSEIQGSLFTSRSDLFKDVERDRVARLVVKDVGRLSANPKEMEGLLYELKQRMVELLSVEDGGPVEL